MSHCSCNAYSDRTNTWGGGTSSRVTGEWLAKWAKTFDETYDYYKVDVGES